ncbi:MAG TPA: hypothetical protein VK306_00100 [Acidimicrobiales bacterium]|nr:hypothetical protein [Acidimicrobiales bacterium]
MPAPSLLRRHRFAVALVAWTFVVWTTRIANIWRDEGLDTGGKVVRTALALSFTVLALAVVAALWRARRLTVPAVAALAAWTVAVWVVRGAGLVAGDHEVGFKVVHTVLAVVSIGLAVLAWRETRGAVPVPAGRDRVVAGRRDP